MVGEYVGWIIGALEGALEGVVEGALDGALEGALEGVVEGALEGEEVGAPDGATYGPDEGDLDGGAPVCVAFAHRHSTLCILEHLTESLPWTGCVICPMLHDPTLVHLLQENFPRTKQSRCKQRKSWKTRTTP